MVKITASYFVDITKIILKLVWRGNKKKKQKSEHGIKGE